MNFNIKRQVHNFKPFYINLNDKLEEISKPWVMGILNVTPDSFFSGSRCDNEDAISRRVKEICDQGADLIDIGGYSSRPNAIDISPEEEMDRLKLGLDIIRREVPNAIVSVDTFRASVARQCIEEYGVNIINDISGGTLDNDMWDTVAELNTPYILMHMRGNPSTMNSLTDYSCVTADVIKDLGEKVSKLAAKGVNDIIIDPGFGFSKTVEQNYSMLNNLDEFVQLNLPILAGISRKSMIYKLLGNTPETSLNGTTVLNTISLIKGANILRVHDVKEAVETVKLYMATTNS